MCSTDRSISRFDAAVRVIRGDGNDVHDTHTLVERVERNGGKPHWPPVRNRDEYIPLAVVGLGVAGGSAEGLHESVDVGEQQRPAEELVDPG